MTLPRKYYFIAFKNAIVVLIKLNKYYENYSEREKSFGKFTKLCGRYRLFELRWKANKQIYN